AVAAGVSANLPSQERARVDIDGATAPPIPGGVRCSAFLARALPPAEMACVCEAAAASAVDLRPLIMAATSAPGVLDPLASSLSIGPAPLQCDPAESSSRVAEGRKRMTNRRWPH